MALSPETRRLLQQALKIRHSEVPLHRVLDILATPDGDISEAINRFRDIKDPDLRRAFHHCALLLRALEAEAGLRPAWEGDGPRQQVSREPAQGSQSATPSKQSTKKTPRFRPEDLQPFEDETMRGAVPIAKIYVDGASRGNPGPAGIGVAAFTLDGRKIAQISRHIGTTTNNMAEYTALIEALHLAHRMGIRQVFILSDSELMVRQMTGAYKIKSPDLFQKAKEAQALARAFEKFRIDYIGREHNALADALSTAPLKAIKPAPDTGQESGGDFLPPLDDNPDEGSSL
jgi:ribonuclease HI